MKKKLADILIALRSRRGLSPYELAAEAGVSKSTIYRVEQGDPANRNTIRIILRSLHLRDPLTETEVHDVATASGISEGSLLYELGSVRADPPDLDIPIEAWRARLHALADRMLARAERPEDVETAMVAMVAAFEAAMPEAPDGPMLTKRNAPQQAAPGIITETAEHYYPAQRSRKAKG